MSDQVETEASIIADILSRPAAPEDAPAAPAARAVEAAPAAPPPSEAALALARIAALDAEVAALRKERAEAAKASAAPPAPTKRTSVTADDLRYDPIRSLEELGIPDEVLAQFLVAKHAGPNAPVDFRVQAALMPQLGALQASVRGEVTSLRGRLEEYEAREADRAFQDSVQKASTGVSPEKHPTLARAMAADRDGTLADLLRSARVARGDASGSPGDAIAKAIDEMEASYAALAKRLAPPAAAASPNGSASKQASSPRSAPPATMANLAGPPPTKASFSDLSYEEQEAKLREEFLSRV